MTFKFPLDALSSKYDEWSFYRNQFNGAFGGTRAVDIVYADSESAWLIEIKDYREHVRTKAIDLPDEIAFKVRDTLAGLMSAARNANDGDEKRVARAMLRKTKLRLVLHLEQPSKHSRLRPQGKAIDPAAVLKKMKGLLKPIDPHLAVVDMNSLKPEMNWTVT